eukprot:COSAG04_NODE_2197_length_4552_cov_6.754098_3_plen_46_part_01
MYIAGAQPAVFSRRSPAVAAAAAATCQRRRAVDDARSARPFFAEPP